MSTLEKISEQRSFGGVQGIYRHDSTACAGQMRFAVYQPPQAEKGPCPVLYYLAGLTCTEETATIKAGAQRWASELGLVLVMPDTSPRGTTIEGATGDWEFGEGAGFYLDATQAPWSKNFRMYSYIVDELPALIAENFPIDASRSSIFGHSMGGHGALTIALKNPHRYRSVSAFAPIVAPSQVPWGHKALPRYLGEDTSTCSTRPAPRPGRRCCCAGRRATTTATGLSLPLWKTTFVITRRRLPVPDDSRRWDIKKATRRSPFLCCLNQID
jgi:S-formylglutathione hydrolase